MLPFLFVRNTRAQKRTVLWSLRVGFLGAVDAILTQMHGDPTLTRITDTTPGELGAAFWLRLASFLAIPTVTLLAAQFPAIGGFLFSWLQPALQALK